MRLSLRRASVSWALGGVVAVAGLTFSLVAFGDTPNYPECTKQVSKQEQEAAKGAHQAAKGFAERNEWDKAVRYWRDAYDFDCNAHPLLINIGNAYEKLGDLPAAIVTFETYLKRQGYDTEVADRVHAMKDKLAPKPSVTASAAPPPSVTASASAPPPPPDGPRPFGFTPLGVTIGGAVLAVVGAILVPVGVSDIAEANKFCLPDANGVAVCDTREHQEQGVRGNILGAVGGASLGVGVAAVAGGLVWHFAFNKPKAGPPKAQVVPTFGPGSVGVAGRF